MASKDEIRRVSIYINGTDADATLRQLQNGSRRLYNELANLVPGTDAFRERAMRLREVNAVLTDIQQDIRGIGGAFEEIKRIAEGVSIGTLVSKSIETALEAVNEFIAGSEAAYDEAQRTQTQLAAAIKSTGGVAGESIEKLQNYQETLMEQTGVDDDVIAKGQEMLLTFTNIRGYIFDQATPAIVDMTAAMNGGKVTMEGIQKTAIQVGKALQDPIAGVTSLQKVGVRLDEQQKQQIKTLVESNHMMDAQAIILKELQKEFGGVAKAIADTDVGKLQQFETDMGNLQEKIGGFLTQGKAAWAGLFDPLIKALADTRTEGQKLTDEFAEQARKVDGLKKNTEPLLERYDQLKEKSSLNKTEQAELKTVIDQIAETIPTAVSQWDKLGNAMSINTDKAREYVKVQKALLEYQNKDAIAALTKENDKLKFDSEALVRQMNKGTTTETIGGGTGGMGTDVVRDLTAKELTAMQERVKEITEQIEKNKTTITALKGDYLDAINKQDGKVTPPTSGPSQADQDAARRKAEEYKKDLESVRDLYVKVAQEAGKGTVDELNTQLAAIDRKYQDIVSKLKKLANDPHTTAAIKKELLADLEAIGTDGGLNEQERTNAILAYRKKQVEDSVKEQESRFKDAASKLDDQFSSLSSELDARQEKALNGVSDSDPKIAEAKRYDIQQLYAQKAYQLEQEHLSQMKALYQSYGKDAGAIDKKIADNTIKENQRAAREKIKQEQEYKIAKKSLQDFELDTAAQGAKLLESVLGKNTVAYKAAFAVEQGIAAARVIFNTEASIAAYAASVAALGPLGLGLLSAYTVTARISEAISLAAIAKTAIDGLKGEKTAGFADGGYSAVDYSDPSGWVKRPTLFTRSASGRPFIAGEGYKSEYIISSAQLRDPVVANFVGMMEGNRLRRQFENGGYTSTPTTAPPQVPAYPVAPDHSARLDRIEAAIDKLHAIVKAEAEKPVVWSYQTAQRETDKLVQITNKASGK